MATPITIESGNENIFFRKQSINLSKSTPHYSNNIENVDIYNDIAETLAVFKFDMTDSEVHLVEQFLTQTQSLVTRISNKTISDIFHYSLAKAFKYAVETQNGKVIIDFFKQLASDHSAELDEKCFSLTDWYSNQVHKNLN